MSKKAMPVPCVLQGDDGKLINYTIGQRCKDAVAILYPNKNLNNCCIVTSVARPDCLKWNCALLYGHSFPFAEQQVLKLQTFTFEPNQAPGYLDGFKDFMEKYRAVATQKFLIALECDVSDYLISNYSIHEKQLNKYVEPKNLHETSELHAKDYEEVSDPGVSNDGFGEVTNKKENQYPLWDDTGAEVVQLF